MLFAISFLLAMVHGPSVQPDIYGAGRSDDHQRDA